MFINIFQESTRFGKLISLSTFYVILVIINFQEEMVEKSILKSHTKCNNLLLLLSIILKVPESES
jgi:hypothetical protein